MTMILFNPTNEDFDDIYAGETVIIKAGAKIKVDDNRGRAVINKLGRRGLMTLEYGDEGGGEEKKSQEGRARHLNFIRQQVIRFNEQQAQRKQMNLGGLNPAKHIKRYAEETGIQLYMPYQAEDEASKTMGRLSEEKRDLEDQVREKDTQLEALSTQMSDMQQQMAALMKMVGNQAPQPSQEGDNGIEAEYKMMTGEQFLPWLSSNWERVSDSEPAVRADIATKYKRLYKTAMPASIDEIDKVAVPAPTA